MHIYLCRASIEKEILYFSIQVVIKASSAGLTGIVVDTLCILHCLSFGIYLQSKGCWKGHFP